MDSFYFALQKIRERPGLFLGAKSLERLVHFWHGYDFRHSIEVWEATTGHNFFEHYDEAINSDLRPEPHEQYFMSGFDEFVHEYYNCMITTWRGTSIISQNSNSDEEAFDKFFELLDEFLELTDIQKKEIKEAARKRVSEFYEDV